MEKLRNQFKQNQYFLNIVNKEIKKYITKGLHFLNKNFYKKYLLTGYNKGKAKIKDNID